MNSRKKVSIEDRILNIAEKLGNITGVATQITTGAVSLAIYNHKAVAEITETTINRNVRARKALIANKLRNFRHSR